MILRLCVVVPTFNNPNTISEVLKDIVLTMPYPILVIDDGSSRPVEECLYSWDVRQAMESGRIRVVRRPKNRGKGAALQFAIRDLVAQGFTHMLTMDGDGQHKAEEAIKLAGAAKENPWDLIIGNRKMTGAVPGASRFGRRFSNFWVEYQTGIRIHDSQSGLRLYPLFAIQNYSFVTRRYDFEIEVLIRMVWNGIRIREIETEVVYFGQDKRVSHFHKFWDNVHLTILNTALVIISLLKSHTSPWRLALSAGLGVAIGCSPFIGFHSLMAFGLSVASRLNLVAMWLGSQISIPPLMPFLLLASVYLGGQWLGVPLGEGVFPQFRQWLVGSAVLGLGLGTIVAGFTFFAARAVRRRGRSNWTGHRRGGRFGNAFMAEVLRRLGLRAGYVWLFLIVPYFYWFAPKARRGLHEYYRLLRPEAGFFARAMAIHRHFFRFGQVLMDKVYQGYFSEPKFKVSISGLETFPEEARSEKGAIVLGAHLGGWDLAAPIVAKLGLDVQRIEYRADKGQNQDTIFDIHQALRLGRVVGLMGDRPLSDRFELIPFLGRLAPFDVTAFRLAAATQSPLTFVFGFKGKGQEYLFSGRPARVYSYAPGIPRELQLYAWVEQYVREMENWIRRYPDQWFNFYPFWSAIPTAPSGQPIRSGGHCWLEELPLPAGLQSGFIAADNSTPAP